MEFYHEKDNRFNSAHIRCFFTACSDPCENYSKYYDVWEKCESKDCIERFEQKLRDIAPKCDETMAKADRQTLISKCKDKHYSGLKICIRIKEKEQVKAGLALTQLKGFKEGIIMYRVYYRNYPEKLDELVNTPDGRPIIENIPDDPWGNPYVFEKNDNKIKLYSTGFDGQPNTEDDIVVNSN